MALCEPYTVYPTFLIWYCPGRTPAGRSRLSHKLNLQSDLRKSHSLASPTVSLPAIRNDVEQWPTLPINTNRCRRRIPSDFFLSAMITRSPIVSHCPFGRSTSTAIPSSARYPTLGNLRYTHPRALTFFSARIAASTWNATARSPPSPRTYSTSSRLSFTQSRDQDTHAPSLAKLHPRDQNLTNSSAPCRYGSMLSA